MDGIDTLKSVSDIRFESEARAREIAFLRTKRYDLGAETASSQQNSVEIKPNSINEVFGNTYANKELHQAKSARPKSIDGKRLTQVLVGNLREKYGTSVDIEKLLNDETFVRAAQDYVEIDDDSENKEAHEKWLNSQKQFEAMFFELSSDAEHNQKIFSALKASSTEWKVNEFIFADEINGPVVLAKKNHLFALRSEGKIGDEEYLKAIDAVNAEYVKASGNKKLQALWEQGQTQSATVTERGPNNEVSLKTSVSMASAVQQVNDSLLPASGWKVTFAGDDGKATIYAGENLIVDMDLYMNLEGEFVFYLEDQFGHGDKKGPYSASEIPGKVDARQVDGYITERISKLTTDKKHTEGIKNVPDDMLSDLGLKLVRSGKDRQYQIKDDDRVILNNFTACLIVIDKEGDKVYPTMFDKVKALNEYLKKESNVEPLIKKLYNGGLEFSVAEAPTISRMIRG